MIAGRKFWTISVLRVDAYEGEFREPLNKSFDKALSPELVEGSGRTVGG